MRRRSALDALRVTAVWAGGEAVDPGCGDPDHLERHVRSSTLIVDGTASSDVPGPRLDHAGSHVTLARRYSKPFTMHASIAPSAAVAHWDEQHLHVWSHSQNVEALRRLRSPTWSSSLSRT